MTLWRNERENINFSREQLSILSKNIFSTEFISELKLIIAQFSDIFQRRFSVVFVTSVR
jgi:hypothetical protein